MKQIPKEAGTLKCCLIVKKSTNFYTYSFYLDDGRTDNQVVEDTNNNDNNISSLSYNDSYPFSVNISSGINKGHPSGEIGFNILKFRAKLIMKEARKSLFCYIIAARVKRFTLKLRGSCWKKRPCFYRSIMSQI